MSGRIMTCLDAPRRTSHDRCVSDTVKFSSKMKPEVLAQLRAYAAESGRTVASVLNEAVEQYIGRERVRPAFREAAEHVMDEHAALLERLAR